MRIKDTYFTQAPVSCTFRQFACFISTRKKSELKRIRPNKHPLKNSALMLIFVKSVLCFT